jgi:hypothetical protein
MHIRYDDINEAYSDMHIRTTVYGKWEPTRNGKALVWPEPVIVTHTNPERRVLFDPVRDANPFFHYMEAIWMLSGENNVGFPAQFAKNILNYSDDGMTIHGAYGHRWRNHFELDQIEHVIYLLQKDPSSRRAVIAMWSPEADLCADSKDLPCNTHIYFRVVNYTLEMTVCNRSNDMVWGMLGANFVHFTILQEYIAGALFLEAGKFHQITNNLHVYEQHVDKFVRNSDTWYGSGECTNRKFSPDTLNWQEARRWVHEGLDSNESYYSRILLDNATPMMASWEAYKDGEFDLAKARAKEIWDDDWAEACLQWLKRREKGKDELQEG